MKWRMPRWLLFFLLISSSVSAQHVIEGRVVDKQTGQPVPFASIGIIGTSRGTSSNLNGQFTLTLPDSFEVKISCVGYETIILRDTAALTLIRLKPTVVELREIIISSKKKMDARKIVRKAFSLIPENYNTKPFLQKFFYRHYCKDGAVYGRLIEAFVDVWKNNGYGTFQSAVGINEQLQVTQLRRSLDNTIAAQGHEPISINSILQTDLAAYQQRTKKGQVDFFNTVSNLKTDFDYYSFTYSATTVHDGQEVYLIEYTSKKDSVLTTTGYQQLPTATGTLYITTDSFAIIKAEGVKSLNDNVIQTAAYYREYEGKYYPYHFILEGTTDASSSKKHHYHIELMSTEIVKDATMKFTGSLPDKETLLNIPYDSTFWRNATVLKTTPLEDKIISDLGGGTSLSTQFKLYQQYAWSTSNGSVDAEKKLRWLLDFYKGKKLVYLMFWDSNCPLDCVLKLEDAKRIQKKFRDDLVLVFIALEFHEDLWKQRLIKYNLFADGAINYTIEKADLFSQHNLSNIPGVVLVLKDGTFYREGSGEVILEQTISELTVKQK